MPQRLASAITSSPAQTKVSLLARPIRLPARIAARVGFKPTIPTTAVITQSASGIVAAWISPSSPQAIRMGKSKISFCSSCAAASVAITAKAGRYFRHCSAILCTLVPAVSAATGIFRLSTISNVCRPIEPVDPRILIHCIIYFTTIGIVKSNSSTRGATMTIESKRSKIPPWPGIKLP